MNNEPLITVIIPTKNRAETLEHTLRTCTTQSYRNLTILVSDNVSTDHTREIVEAATDPRVRYINPGQSLSMSYHWEFALSHVKEGFVTVLGDDDGFMPNAIAEAATILSETKSKALATNYGLYWWPAVFDETKENLLHISLRSGYKRLNAKNELRQVIEGKKHYLSIPCIYNSFIEVSLIEQAKKSTGSFFHSQIPDVYSSIALTGLLDEFIYSQKSLKLFGISRKSNGAAYLGKPGNKEIIQLFYQDETIPIHPLAYDTTCKSVSLIVGESLLQSFDAGLNQDFRDKFDWWVFIDAAIREAKTSGQGNKEEIFRSIGEIVSKNDLREKAIAKIDTHTFSFKASLSVLSRIRDVVAILDASKYGVTNIQDACVLCDKIMHRPFAYPEIVPSTILKLTETAAFQTLKELIGLRKK